MKTTFKGEVVGVDIRYRLLMGKGHQREIFSSIDFDTGNSARVRIEVPDELPLGTKFLLTLEEEMELP